MLLILLEKKQNVKHYYFNKHLLCSITKLRATGHQDIRADQRHRKVTNSMKVHNNIRKQAFSVKDFLSFAFLV